MKKALFWKTVNKEKKIIQCELCPHMCVLAPDLIGKCRVRQNKEGVFQTLVYGKPVSVNLDPIEKKPLYHILPGLSPNSGSAHT
jgi:pyruvate formate lyase activating enzyme